MKDIVQNLKSEVQQVLVGNILPYWVDRMEDHKEGGFYGRITGHEMLMAEAEKGAILNARILWTFSAACRLLKKGEYMKTAERAKRYLLDHFYDKEYGWCFG